MRLSELHKAVSTPYFTTQQLTACFPRESSLSLNMQLKRFVDRHELIRIKRGIFAFPNQTLDDFVIAKLLNPTSYVSLESALNAYGVIPEISEIVTSVTPLTTKRIQSGSHVYTYGKISKSLFFGYQVVESSSGVYYHIAEPEKALLDYLYIRKINNLDSIRADISSLNKSKLRTYAIHFPGWLRKAINEQSHH